MEHSLTTCLSFMTTCTWCLNPYSNGTLSDMAMMVAFVAISGLNPYSNGTLSDKSL